MDYSSQQYKDSNKVNLTKKLSSYRAVVIKNLLKIFCLEKSKNKQSNIASICDFLLNPLNLQEIESKLPENIKLDLVNLIPDPLLLCVCNSKELKPLIICESCNKKQHIQCIEGLNVLEKYVCIKCNFCKFYPQFKIIEFLTDPFVVTTGVTNQILKISPKLYHDYTQVKNYHLYIKCLGIDFGKISLAWPEGKININGIYCETITSVNRKSFNNDGLNITGKIAEGKNVIEYETNDEKKYYMSVMIVHKNTENEIYEKMSQGRIDKHSSIQYLSPLSADQTDLAIDRQKINLKCPYTYMLIDTPVRGESCKHITCFDLLTFIRRQPFENYEWKCPVCKYFANSLKVDEFFLEIISKIKGENNKSVTDEVLIESNGNFELIYKEPEEEHVLKRIIEEEEKEMRRPRCEIIEIDD